MRVAGEDRWSAIDDASRLRDALGVSLPPGRAAGLPRAGAPTRSVTSSPATPAPTCRSTPPRWPAPTGSGPPSRTTALARLVSSGRVVEGELLPTGGGGTEFCDAEVLRLLRRRSLAALRAEVEPVTPVELARFLQGWQGVGGRLRGRDGLLRVVEQLQRCRAAGQRLESLVLPTRVADYSPALLDELMTTGEVLWCGHGSLPGDDGWVSLHLADSAHVTLPGPDPDRVPLGRRARRARRPRRRRGALLPHPVRRRSAPPTTQASRPRCGTSPGRVGSPATRFAPVRALLSGGRTAHKRSPSGPRRTRYAGRRGPLGGLGRRSGPPRAAGPHRPTAGHRPLVAAAAGRPRPHPARLRHRRAAARPARHPHPRRDGRRGRAGRLRRDLPGAGRGRGGRAGAPRLLRRGAGRLPVRHDRAPSTGCAAARRSAPGGDHGRAAPTAVVLATSDPANPYGAALPWPDRAVDPAAGDAPARRRVPPTSAAATSRAARPVPSSCSSTATSCSTSSAVARRC